MTDEAITDSAGLNGPVSEKPAPRKRSVGTTRATKKKAETVPVENVAISEQKIGEVDTNVISAPQKAHTDGPVSNTSTSADGVIGSKAADRVFEKPVQPEPKVDDSNKAALWSNKNIRWTGVGTLTKGYNIVTKEAAEKWLVREGIREATPEEVATHFGK
jgi:hypothetical protein